MTDGLGRKKKKIEPRPASYPKKMVGFMSGDDNLSLCLSLKVQFCTLIFTYLRIFPILSIPNLSSFPNRTRIFR